jgi:hypothetical protein
MLDPDQRSDAAPKGGPRRCSASSWPRAPTFHGHVAAKLPALMSQSNEEVSLRNIFAPKDPLRGSLLHHMHADYECYCEQFIKSRSARACH